MEILQRNIQAVKDTIVRAAENSHRDPNEITLIAVSKTVPVEQIQEARLLGITNFGENYVQEALPKIASLNDDSVTWHMIGPVQSNKVNKVVPEFDYIHTIDSPKLAKKISDRSHQSGVQSEVLIQVNISGEATKSGVAPGETEDLIKQIAQLPGIEVVGLMTIAPHVDNPEDTRRIFRSLRELRDNLQQTFPQLNLEHLSMGMSNDYQVAIEEGATMVRVGTAIFGSRRPSTT